MAGRRGLQQRMREEVRKRQRQGRPQPVATGNVRRDQWDEITRSHADVLIQIEATLVDCWRDVEGVDDAWAHMALVAAMRDESPEHPTAWYVYCRLKALRQRRDDLAPDLWLDALRVVDQSVRDHSTLRHGDRSYLGFIEPFVDPHPAPASADREIIEARISPPRTAD